MPVSDLPPELLDAIIDEIQEDKKSLLQASLVCKAFCPRTRVHLFSVALLSSWECSCERLRELITLSPKLALHFKSLRIVISLNPDLPFSIYEPLTVIGSLPNITDLYLIRGVWEFMPAPVVSCLQSYSYRILSIDPTFFFRRIGDICSLVQNSPNLQEVRLALQSSITECDHSLHRTTAPATAHIIEPTLLKSVLPSGPCPFSCSNIRILHIALPDTSTVPRYVSRYLALSPSSLKHLFVSHFNNPSPGFRDRSSETLNISNVELVTVKIEGTKMTLGGRAFHIFEWWISNLSAVNVKHCAIRSITFTIIWTWPKYEKPHPALDWEDLWMRLDSCLTSSKIASLERVAFIFDPRPAGWDTFKTRMEGKFRGLKELGCEVSLNAMGYDNRPYF
ncbi:uncharacterized protein EV420DRAFT_802510 [Desarmillaria tabescens]|uniref:F-box domain-containing protein n=1 Tax=Armillaria tabescens TaxID=1929756 RepID=A0AA39NHW4_ARMTA|nr:uncharacterized protein EV420DRAFT_802510 [Desarmillaria tabescens]KAK0465935.1 hypothetical protein EV420DRAFT_802510 [Desarmillaria tabescens]